MSDETFIGIHQMARRADAEIERKEKKLVAIEAYVTAGLNQIKTLILTLEAEKGERNVDQYLTLKGALLQLEMLAERFFPGVDND